jgi:replication-associated recombination protein RarA
MNDYQVRTKKGYDFFEVASAFQKSIRRGIESDAMYWAIELYESGYAKYVWKRMLIMSCEDVGLGSPFTNTMVMNLKASFDYLVSLKDKGLSEKLPFTQAVLTLVNAKKSRYVDLAISVYWKENKETMKEMPDYVFDMHTRKGKSMGRGLDYFYDEAAKINNANKLPNEEEMEKIAREADKAYCQKNNRTENISCTKEEGERNSQQTLFD